MSKSTDAWEIDSRRKGRKKKKKNKSTAVIVVLVLALIVVLAGVGTIGLSYYAPAVADKIPPVKFVKDNVLNVTNDTTDVADVQQTKPATTQSQTTNNDKPEEKSYWSYLESSEFDFVPGKDGNFVGNLLNGGKVGIDAYYVYHIVDGKGIYRFEPNNEESAIVVDTKHELSCLNLRGNYIYYIDEDEGALIRKAKDSKVSQTLAEDVSIAYVYDTTLYYITKSNSVHIMNIDNLEQKQIYQGEDKLQFIGISLSQVFVSETSFSGDVSYITFDYYGNESGEFRAPTKEGEIVNMMMEHGFMYYYERQDDDTYNLVRQKFGSDKIVTLVENVTDLSAPVVDANKLYYARVSGTKYYMQELNMNTNDTKVLVYDSNVSNANDVNIYHSGEYDFIIGGSVNKGSSNLTSSSHAMTFSKGSWKY